MDKKALAALCICAASQQCWALSAEELKLLREAVNDMCLFPDRAGDYVRVEGEAKVGTAVPIKIVKGDISGKIDYGTWKGIPITLDKYRKDPRECAIEMTKILLPAFSSSAQSSSRPGAASKPISYLDNSGLRLGSSVDAFKSATAGQDVKWKSATPGAQAVYQSKYMGVKANAFYTFVSGRLVKVEYSSNSKYSYGQYFDGEQRSPLPGDDEYNSDETSRLCNSLAELPSKFIDKFGEPIAPERNEHSSSSEEYGRADVRWPCTDAKYTCRGYEGESLDRKIIRFSLPDTVSAELRIDRFRNSREIVRRDYGQAIGWYRTNGCWLVVTIEKDDG
jgi:hypothetical protein